MDKPLLKASVFSDYICPFCYVGSRRLLRLNDTYDLRVNWCGIEIHPDTPASGMPVAELGYPDEQWARMQALLAALAEEEGIVLAPRHATTNSRDALLLAEAAKECGREAFYRLHEALFAAYFSDGRNLGDREVLRDIVRLCGLPAELPDRAWRDPGPARRLAFHLQAARQLGLRGTPTYVIGERIIAGVVPVSTLRAAARRALAADEAGSARA